MTVIDIRVVPSEHRAPSQTEEATRKLRTHPDPAQRAVLAWRRAPDVAHLFSRWVWSSIVGVLSSSPPFGGAAFSLSLGGAGAFHPPFLEWWCCHFFVSGAAVSPHSFEWRCYSPLSFFGVAILALLGDKESSTTT